MFRTIEVKNFRCFADLRLGPLARVNLIAGRNNTGKTALLEAIRLHCNPLDGQLAYQLVKDRGVNLDRADLASVASWLFFDRDPSKEVVLKSEDERGSRLLTITLEDAVTARERYAGENALLLPPFQSALGDWLVLRYQGDSEESIASAYPTGRNGLTWGGGKRISWKMPNAFLPASLAGEEDDVNAYGELESAKRQEEILPALRLLEPRLQRLSLIPFAGAPVLHGDVGLSRLVPLPLMGEGLRRLLSLLLAIATHKGGVVLIDEIENGLHHSVLNKVWQAVALAARLADIQLFATTHSYECIQAAHAAFEAAEPYDFALHRLDRTDAGIRPVTYDRDTMGYALEMSHEVR
jgi:hypothetical protein